MAACSSRLAAPREARLCCGSVCSSPATGHARRQAAGGDSRAWDAATHLCSYGSPTKRQHARLSSSEATVPGYRVTNDASKQIANCHLPSGMLSFAICHPPSFAICHPVICHLSCCHLPSSSVICHLSCCICHLSSFAIPVVPPGSSPDEDWPHEVPNWSCVLAWPCWWPWPRG